MRRGTGDDILPISISGGSRCTHRRVNVARCHRGPRGDWPAISVACLYSRLCYRDIRHGRLIYEPPLGFLGLMSRYAGDNVLGEAVSHRIWGDVDVDLRYMRVGFDDTRFVASGLVRLVCAALSLVIVLVWMYFRLGWPPCGFYGLFYDKWYVLLYDFYMAWYWPRAFLIYYLLDVLVGGLVLER